MEALQILDELGPIDSKADVMRLISDLRGRGIDTELVTELVTQARLRHKAQAKFGDFASRMLFTSDGLEQATRLQLAAHHAGRFKTAGLQKVADIGCGIGADALAMAAIGLDVTAIELDPTTASFASFNLAGFSNAEVKIADAEHLDYSEFDGLYFDPARRDLTGPKRETHRRLAPSDYSPDLDFVWRWAAQKPSGVKLAPGFERELLPPEIEAQWVSIDGSLLELTAWSGALAKPGVLRSALAMRGGQAWLIEASDPNDWQSILDLCVDPKLIYEPDAALIRSELMSVVAREHGLAPLSHGLAYLGAQDEVSSPWLRGYRVLESLKFDVPTIRKALAAREIGQLEIKKRGIEVTPEELRPKLKLKGKNAATLILTRVDGAHRAFICESIR
jgi:SAM-dependent methyltransferase